MEGLRVRTERYEQTSRATTGPAGDRRTYENGEIGEVSLPAASAESFISTRLHTPLRFASGSTAYFYSTPLALHDHGRPWVRREQKHLTPYFPYHQFGSQHGARSGGSYAGLISLIKTVIGKVHRVGQTTIDGQSTTEFAATVDPARLIRDTSPEDHEFATSSEATIIGQLRLRSLPTRLDMFITDSGLPIRILTSAKMGMYSISETTEILATNMPVKIKAPSARETVSEAQFAQIYSRGLP